MLYADETPARAAGKLHYVHVACTEFLTAMHTGDRTKEAIYACGILPGYTGTIVRDGYKGYEHLTDALHAWCGAHGLRDLALAAPFLIPRASCWARSMADLLIDANAQATAARAAGQASLDDDRLARIRSWYRGAVAEGLDRSTGKTSQIAADGRTLARRFRDHEDMILRFTTDLAVGFTSNQAERDVRPPSRCSSAPPAGPGAPWPDWPTSRSSAPTCPPPPNGVSTPSTSSPGSSRTGPGSRPPPHHPDQHAGRDRGRHPRHQAPTTAPPGICGSTGMPGTTNISRPLKLRLNSYGVADAEQPTDQRGHPLQHPSLVRTRAVPGRVLSSSARSRASCGGLSRS